MNKYITLIATISLIAGIFLLNGCNSNKDEDKQIKFAIAADYPPFEYVVNGELKGFDVELAELLAKRLGKKAVFEDMQFSTIPVAIQNGLVDAGISSIEITANHQKNIDFSNCYHTAGMALVFLKDHPITTTTNLSEKKIACQLGASMETWLKQHTTNHQNIITIDNVNQAIEALKAGHVDGVLIDQVQGITFSKKNPNLSYFIIKSENCYGIAFKQGSPLKNKINLELKSLENQGELAKLKKKWLETAL